MPALGPARAPEVTPPAAFQLVPIFPLHIAPGWVSDHGCNLGTRSQGCSPTHPCLAQLGNAQSSLLAAPRAGEGTSVRASVCLCSIYSVTPLSHLVLPTTQKLDAVIVPIFYKGNGLRVEKPLAQGSRESPMLSISKASSFQIQGAGGLVTPAQEGKGNSQLGWMPWNLWGPWREGGLR